MELIGHRGCGGQYPENTVGAVRAAAPHVEYVEIDVRRCGSGELVVFHDETLDRLTGATGAIRETPLETIRDLRVAGSDEGVPLLGELLESVPADVGVLVELKADGVEREVLEATARVDNRTGVISFDPAAIERVHEIDPDAWTGLIFVEAPRDGLRTADDLDCAFVHAPYEACTDGAFVAAAHDAGLEVHAGTISTRAVAEEVVDPIEAAGTERLSVDRWDIVQ